MSETTDGGRPYQPVGFWQAVRDGWRWRALWTCFGARRHLPCGGCTPPCGRCAWCMRPVARTRS